MITKKRKEFLEKELYNIIEDMIYEYENDIEDDEEDKYSIDFIINDANQDYTNFDGIEFDPDNIDEEIKYVFNLNPFEIYKKYGGEL